MPPPKDRDDLLEQLSQSFSKLEEELEIWEERDRDEIVEDEWSAKDLLAVRLWWSEAVVTWIEVGRDGSPLELPAPGFRWNDTPRLNQQTVDESREVPWDEIRAQLKSAFAKIEATIDTLDERELLEVGVFPWAEKWPIARWIALNTVRQYTTARTILRRARR